MSEFVRELRVQFPNDKMTSMSGVSVTDEVVSEFQTIKLGKKYSYIQMKISDDKKVDNATYPVSRLKLAER